MTFRGGGGEGIVGRVVAPASAVVTFDGGPGGLEEVIRACYKIRYFGAYIRYLPTSPMSLQLGLTTDIFRYLFRISTSSFTVELVYFY